MPSFLTQTFAGVPLWLAGSVVIVGGALLYIWFKHRSTTNAANQAQSTSGVSGANPAYNPLNPSNDPNIDSNTGVPYQIEQAINPNTNTPYYYSSASSPSPTPSPTDTTAMTTTPAPTAPTTTPAVPAPIPAPAPAFASTIGGQLLPGGTESYASNLNTQFNATGETVPQGGKTYTFYPTAGTGQTNHLWNVAIQEYGVQGTQATNAATQAIINANPNLAGKSFTYQPPAGTQIVIPQV
jgi:hypothetical protein